MSIPSSGDPDTGDEDDRTVVRPSAAARSEVTYTPAVPAGDVHDDDERTVVRPSAAPKTEASYPPALPAGDVHSAALPVGTRLGEFEIKQVMAAGGFGIVYRAWDELLNRWVALKEYMPSTLATRASSSQVVVRSRRDQNTFDVGLRSFVNEAHSLAQFDHPSLVRVYRFWEANGTAYMVMPLCEGLTLSETLAHLGAPPDEDWLLSLLAPLTEALAVIHAEQLYHRDIAPDNIILLARDGRPVLLDFGAARRVIGDTAHAPTVIVKAGYAPVEQYDEVPGMEQGPWTDIYALAAVVHFALAGGKLPSALARYAHDSYVPLSQRFAGRYSDGFLQAIDRGLAVRPADRTQSIEDFRHDMGLPSLAPDSNARLQSTLKPGAVPDSRSMGPRAASAAPPGLPAAKAGAVSGTSSRTWIWAVGGILGVAVLGAAGYYATRKGPSADVVAVQPTGRANTAAPNLDAESATAGAAQPAPIQPAPVPAAPVPRPEPAPVLPFTVLAGYDEVLRGQDPGFAIEAAPERTRLRVDRDEVNFHVKSARNGFVYVLVSGPDGTLDLWFPNSVDANNRVQAGIARNLPTPSWKMKAADPLGIENFLVIVSAAPRDFSEFGNVREAGSFFLKLPTGDAAARLLKGGGRAAPLYAGAVNCSEAGCGAYGAARFTVEVVR